MRAVVPRGIVSQIRYDNILTFPSLYFHMGYQSFMAMLALYLIHDHKSTVTKLVWCTETEGKDEYQLFVLV